MDKLTLLTANAVILSVFSVCFLVAYRHKKNAGYCATWALANLMLAAALVFWILEANLPTSIVCLVPNGLLLAGFALHWSAARDFVGRRNTKIRVLAPVAILCIISAPALATESYGVIYTMTNVMLVILAFGTSLEYLSNRFEGLSSRHGLAVGYALIAASFGIRALQGIAEGRAMSIGQPDDILLTIHLIVVLIYVSTSGAFSLAIAYEHTAAEHRNEAHRDPLTGAYNRREFELRLRALLATRDRPPFAVLQFDLDHFKRVNDRFGHVAGDEALQLCADLIKWNLRDIDCLARLGGEEFSAILPNVSQVDALKIAENIRRTVAQTSLDFAPGDFHLTLSAGVYHGTGEGLSYKKLMQVVDEGLYLSKNTGRNRISLAEAA